MQFNVNDFSDDQNVNTVLRSTLCQHVCTFTQEKKALFYGHYVCISITKRILNFNNKKNSL